MSIQQLKNELGDYAKDIKLNLSTVLTEEGAPELNQQQIYSIALASAYATKNQKMINALLPDVSQILSESELNAAKSAAAIMAMNNIYYRFVHLTDDKEIAKLPAKLRMNVMSNPGISKIDFELMSLAISAINGCGMCMEAHTRTIIQAGVKKTSIQSCIRIASVIHAVAQVLVIDGINEG